MRNYIKIFGATFMVFSLLFFSCKSKKAGKPERIEEQKIEDNMDITISQSNNSFAFDFMRAIGNYDENLAVSPFSISSALAMTYAGAGGDTEKQMAKTLHFSLDQDNFHVEYSKYIDLLKSMAGGMIELNIANKLWGQQGFHFRKEFFQILESLYQAGLIEVDFEGGDREAIRQEINAWVYEMTKENIKDLIPPRTLVPDTRLVLVNAIHFLGSWLIEFDKERTEERTFHNFDNSMVNTPFMFREGEFSYFESNYMQAIEIPYSGGTYSMVVLLPTGRISLEEIEKGLDHKTFSELLSNLSKTKVEVFLPKFKAEYKADLEDLLSEMGMPLAFSNNADFSRMTQHDDLKIDKVIHQAIIDVTEEGTEASAATAVIIVRKTAIVDEQKIVFEANRPFLYLIKENNENSIIFMGRQVKF